MNIIQAAYIPLRKIILACLLVSTAAPGVAYAADLKSCNATVTAANIANQIKTQTGCSTAGYVWVPASNMVALRSGPYRVP